MCRRNKYEKKKKFYQSGGIKTRRQPRNRVAVYIRRGRRRADSPGGDRKNEAQ